jgi:sulfatase modifying factor 1
VKTQAIARRIPAAIFTAAAGLVLCQACTGIVGITDLEPGSDEGGLEASTQEDGGGLDGPSQDSTMSDGHGGADGAADVGTDGAEAGSTLDASEASASDASPEASPPVDAGCDSAVCNGPPSCRPGGPGLTTCGAGASQSCCTSLPVTGASYSRTYSNTGAGAMGLADTASVSSFLLDQYEVTVGRFQQFVTAYNSGSGWTPPIGSGKHTHLNGGLGLTDSNSPNNYEPGWQAADTAHLTTNLVGACNYESTWNDVMQDGESATLPINCETWWESYAFCIWDGGFLPSEAEWEYAAAGGGQQAEYAWGEMSPGTGYAYAIYGNNFMGGKIAPVGTAASGVGTFGQLDLAGNLNEWSLDWQAPFVDPCADCAFLTQGTATQRVARGGSYSLDLTWIYSWARNSNDPSVEYSGIGFRCARAP